jgi:hypothetical protein
LEDEAKEAPGFKDITGGINIKGGIDISLWLQEIEPAPRRLKSGRNSRKRRSKSKKKKKDDFKRTGGSAEDVEDADGL